MVVLVAHNFHWWIIKGMEVLYSGCGSYEVGVATAKANDVIIDEFQIQQVA